MKSASQVISEARARVRQVSVPDLQRMVAEHRDVAIIDCREPNEFNLGHIPDAIFIPRGILEQNIEAAVPRDRPIVLYCASGNRSALAALALTEMGYRDVASLDTGIRGWAEAGGDIDG